MPAGAAADLPPPVAARAGRHDIGVRQITMHFETQALSAISSPSTAALVALGLVGLAARRRRA